MCLWQASLPTGTAAPDGPLGRAIDELSDTYALTGRGVANAVRLASGDGTPDAETLAACAAVQQQPDFGANASRQGLRRTMDDLILPDETREPIEEIIATERVRHDVLRRTGLGARLGRGLGLACLLDGPPGTGKTLAAEVIASELALPLYAVNVANVVSKWIGGTEKNLESIFDTAERYRCVLLFDEADALFAKRTEVSGANERHANLEVALLLQLVERHSAEGQNGPSVGGFGEDHEGQGAEAEERPHYRAVHMAFEDAALPQRPAPADSAPQAAPQADRQPETAGALDGVDMTGVLDRATLGDNMLETGVGAGLDLVAELAPGFVFESVLAPLLLIKSTVDIAVAGFDGMSTAVDRHDARAIGFAYALVWTLDGLDVSALPAVSPVASLTPNIHGAVPDNACAVMEGGAWRQLPTESAAEAVDDSRVVVFVTRHSGEWQLGKTNGAYRASNLTSVALTADHDMVVAMWESTPAEARRGMTFAEFGRQVVARYRSVGALLTAALAPASNTVKAEFLSEVYRSSVGPGAGTLTYPESSMSRASRMCGPEVLPVERISERSDEQQDAAEAAATERRRERQEEQRQRTRRAHEMSTAPLATGQEIQLPGGQTVRQ